MKKYINAEVFKAKIMNYGRIYEGDRIPIPFYKEHCGKMFTELLRWVCEEVDDALPADVVEIRHGHWETIDKGHFFYDWKCSNCGASGRADYLFCPNCGAKMDGEQNE